jgi:hypothetical protein
MSAAPANDVAVLKVVEKEPPPKAVRAAKAPAPPAPPPQPPRPFDPLDMPAPIAAAITDIMGAVKNVVKNGTNAFFNYKFARVEDLLFQVQPAMAEAGLVITQDEVATEVLIEKMMKVTYAFSLSHTSGVTWACPIRLSGLASIFNHKGTLDDKAINKCNTGARKYFLMNLFQIPAGDLPDPDVDEISGADDGTDQRSQEERGQGRQVERAHGKPQEPRQEAKKGPSTRWITCQTDIDLCGDEAALNAWKERAALTLAALDDNEYLSIGAHWQACRAKFRAAAAAAAAATNAARPGFELGEDDIPTEFK